MKFFYMKVLQYLVILLLLLYLSNVFGHQHLDPLEIYNISLVQITLIFFGAINNISCLFTIKNPKKSSILVLNLR